MDLDSTYFDLALALDGNLLKGDAQKEAEKLVGELEKTLKIKVQKRDRKFHISFIEKNEEHDAALVATGINKIAQLIYLIMNGSLTKKTIIFWDEPETNLNPKYIIVVAKFLQTLAKAGCQIFVATHDYLLVNELSMSVQFRDVKKDVPDMKFFSLVKGEDGTEILEGEIIAEIQDNPILDAYAKQAETQLGLYAKSLQPTEQ